MFERWNWLDRDEFRKDFGLTDLAKYEDVIITRAIRYGCERVDLECGGTIKAILDGKDFPGKLTKDQADTVWESAAWCANHMLKQGLDWLRGSTSVSLGQISAGQTNPEEPDYFPPFLYKKLVDYSKGYIGVDNEGWAVLVSFNLYYKLLQAAAVQGSDQAYSDLVNGQLAKIWGLPIVPIIYLDNKISVSEEEYTEDGKIKRRPIEEDFTGVDAILFYKNVFAYKFTNPIFKAQEITGSPDQVVFTHVEYFPKKRMPVLPKLCIGFKFNVTYKDGKEEAENLLNV